MLTPPIEVRRGVLFLTKANVAYLGPPIVTPTTAPPQVAPGTGTGPGSNEVPEG